MTRNSDLTRRRFMQGLTAAAASGMLAGVSGSANGATTYTGKFLINLQLTGDLMSPVLVTRKPMWMASA